LHRLQVGKDTRDGGRSGLAAVAQVKDESRIADGIAPEPGRRDVAVPQIFFDISK
jgi:hypothetical protein